MRALTRALTRFFLQANFASYLTVAQFSTVVSNLQDLKKGNVNFTINGGGATYTYFTQSLDPTILTLQPRLSVSLSAGVAW